jgi:hypothetical protein
MECPSVPGRHRDWSPRLRPPVLPTPPAGNAVGDANNDGTTDILLAAPYSSHEEDRAGAAWLLPGTLP